MRTNCPVCGSDKRYTDWTLNFTMPDNWTIPGSSDVCLCLSCGMVWYDSFATQADYDEYYKTKYGYGLDIPEHQLRLDGLAKVIFDTFAPDVRVVDFGGGEGYLVKKLLQLGFKDVSGWNVGDTPPQNVDLIVASHVIEHVYDLKTMMQGFVDVLRPTTGFVLVEVPDALHYSHLTWPPLLDYQTKHINHFPPFCIDLLFANHGFTCLMRDANHSLPYTNYRAMYQRDRMGNHYFRAKKGVEKNMVPKIEALRKITEPVIVYGCSDTVWYLLNKVPDLPVAYFVDEDTQAYPPGSTIGGISVVDKIDTDHPILVMAANQRKVILDKLVQLGLTNEVIQI